MGGPVIIVHGGAGKWPRNRQDAGLRGVERAADVGFRTLRQGGSAMNAVEAAVVSMEDDPVFNAGTGSTLNLLGEIETDAAVMDGKSLQGGGVALLRTVKNPIRLARIVMEKTNHVLLAGDGAQRVAAAFKLPEANLRVEKRVEEWQKARAKLGRGQLVNYEKNRRLSRTILPLKTLDTVGALALDKKGDLAAGCSTGGVSLKLPGRIGDSAILGAGLYADNERGAATATGIGEIAMRLVISKKAVDLMSCENAEQAAENTVRMAGLKIGRGLGMITLHKNGGFGVAHNTPNLCWAARSIDDSKVRISRVRLGSQSQQDF